MGLNVTTLRMLAPYLRVEAVLCLSYPDLVMRGSEAEAILGIKPEKFTDNGGWHGKDFKLPDTVDVFEKLGIKRMKFVDVHASRGIEEIVDLNEPADLGKWDLVIDAGTTEHVFNIGQAIKTAAQAVRFGGVIFHAVPMAMLNHGFWNFSPTALADFYEQNGWRIELITGMGTQGEGAKAVPIRNRFKCMGEGSIVVIARRLSPVEVRWPTQSKYLKNPDLKACLSR